jgi:hypothetical protein
MAASYVRLPAYVELSRSEAESRVSLLSPILELNFNSDSEEYDTDLEIEPSPQPSSRSGEYMYTSRRFFRTSRFGFRAFRVWVCY